MKYLKDTFLILFLVFVDQLSKTYFFGKENFVSNTGALFGLFKGMNSFFIVISLILIGFIIYYYKEDRLRLGFDFVLAGAFGNLIDRVFRGFVVDFIDLKFWPIFNLADVFISFGVIFLIYKILKE